MKYEMQIKNGLAKERNNGAFGTRLMDSQSAARRAAQRFTWLVEKISREQKREHKRVKTGPQQ